MIEHPLRAAIVLTAAVLGSAGGTSSLAQPATPAAPAVMSSGTNRAASPRQAAAQRAGTRALHLCSGYFATENPRALTDATADTVGHPTAPATAPTHVDEVEKTVSVKFSDDMPPRIAVARPVLGCTLLPVGAEMTLARALPRPLMAAPNFDDRPWPIGDRGAVVQLPARKKAAVEALIDEAFKDEAGNYGGVTWGVVVVKNGRIVAERYQHGMGPHFSARTNSMCKSISGSLTGIGVRQGLLDLDRKAPLAEWRRTADPRGQITLRNLMHMASGLYTESAGDRQGLIYQSGAAVAEAAALNVVDSRPGSRFVYAGSDSILLTRALREAIGDDNVYWAFPYRELLWKLGMTRTFIETDSNGDFISSGQCWSTARDFGRFGMLYLADGVWDGERILPEGWSRFVATPAPAQPGGSGPRYGAQFWIHGGREGLPADAYTPNGGRGQYAMIVPSQDLVVVRRGFDTPTAAFRIDKFSADITRAITD